MKIQKGFLLVSFCSFFFSLTAVEPNESFYKKNKETSGSSALPLFFGVVVGGGLGFFGADFYRKKKDKPVLELLNDNYEKLQKRYDEIEDLLDRTKDKLNNEEVANSDLVNEIKRLTKKIETLESNPIRGEIKEYLALRESDNINDISLEEKEKEIIAVLCEYFQDTQEYENEIHEQD